MLNPTEPANPAKIKLTRATKIRRTLKKRIVSERDISSADMLSAFIVRTNGNYDDFVRAVKLT